jgi:flagellar biosynthesis/type III secretory pathway M-ring protein FliF/YscJ
MRSEDIIPEDLRRLLQKPQMKYVLSCALLVVLAVACFWGIRKIAAGQLESINVPLTQTEQADLELALLRSGLWGHKFEGGRLLVPAGKRSEFLRVMSQIDLGARDPGAPLRTEAGKNSFFSTNEERHLKLQVALEDTVAKLLQAIKGIDDAYVHFDETMHGGLHRSREVSAIVSIQPSPGSTMDGKLLASIRRTVAAHKAGLSESNVTIVNRATGDSYDGSMIISDSASQSRELQRMTLQRRWDEELIRVLKFIPGAKVETHVELADARESAERWTAPYPSRIAISIAVPVSYYQGLWKQQVGNPSASGPKSEELAELESQTRSKVESLVQGLVSSSAGDDPPSLHIALFPQVEATATSLARIDSPSTDWLRNNSHKIVQGLMILLAIGLVFFAFRDLFYEDVPEEERAPASEELRVFAADSSEEPRAVPSGAVSQSAARPPASPLETKDIPFIHADLTDLVREHPQAASAMLKSWVEKAS